ncbi:MAG: hypothetical protein JWO46_1340 [Nocardioidaceae bacterium]|nr:hypothetical protein [Nocardioidaceae bacterium]
MSAHPMMTAYLGGARWFAGKGREYDVVDARRVAILPGNVPGTPAVTIDLLTVAYPASGDVPAETEIYQVPLAHYDEPRERMAHAYLGEHDDPDFGHVHSYDAVHDRDAMAVYLRAFASASPGAATDIGGLTFHRLAGHDLDTESHSTLFSGEQSNSSVAFGDDSLLKVFRKVTPGRNPDVEIHRVLTEADNPHVAALYGWVQSGPDDAPLELAMLQQFLRTASDGWDLALSSVRNLLAQPDLPADEAGGDFTGEAERLGAAVAEVHGVLAQTFGESTVDTSDVASVMRARFTAQCASVPDLAAYDAAVGAAFDALDGLGTLSVQRVHGDLHLGQTLRTALGWKLVDFEGEPAKALAERVLPDSPWRDVAGMLRSLDYAARTVVLDAGEGDELGAEWTRRNSDAFLAGYLDGREPTDTERALIAAYVADKAVYEVGYEARNRPSWLPIPFAALAGLSDHPSGTAPEETP